LTIKRLSKLIGELYWLKHKTIYIGSLEFRDNKLELKIKETIEPPLQDYLDNGPIIHRKVFEIPFIEGIKH